MRSIKDFKKILSTHKDRIFNDYSIKSIAIFGSFSRQEENEKSDLDILVEFDGKIGIRFIDLAEEPENQSLCIIQWRHYGTISHWWLSLYCCI